MSWDQDNQRRTADRASMIEYGLVTLGAAGTVEISTYLSEIKSASLARQTGFVADSTLTIDGTITSGAITLTDSAGAINAGGTVYYEFRGVN